MASFLTYAIPTASAVLVLFVIYPLIILPFAQKGE